MTSSYRLQGRGRELQKSLLGEEFRALSRANEEGVPVAYLFISGNVAELFRAFGFRIGYPEVHALQCGIKRAAGSFILRAEDAGYSSDVCGYVKNDVGLLLSGGRAPFGQLPRPDLLVCTYSGCTTYVKWFETLAEATGARLVFLDVPYLRDRDALPTDRAYVVRQLEELIGVCEEVTGRRFEEERLREICALSRRAEDAWVRVLESARRRPSPWDAYFEAVFFMAPLYVLRGTEACARYLETVLAEIEERIEHGIGPVPEERFRVVLEGPPPWPHFRAFWDLFKRWGAVAVASTYSKVGGLFDQGVRHDPERPLESIAEHAIQCYTNWNLGLRRDLLAKYLREYGAEALVIHSVKSCRSFSVGQADTREVFSHEAGVPTLFLESDLVDPRYFSEAQMRNRIDAFFESLEHARVRDGAGGLA